MQQGTEQSKALKTLRPNRWDFIALTIGFTLFVVFTQTAQKMALPFHVGQPLPIHLETHYLPEYAIQTVLRMAIALFFSLLFTFFVAPLAAKNRFLEKIIIPLIDVLQSAPVLSFLSFSVPGFMLLFPNSLLGPECAAIFVIFTSQAWNMVLSLYQSLKTLPKEFIEVSTVLRLSPWQRFWRIEVPFAVPGLLWNTMLSLSASWFFVVASEAISIANQEILLPGIGSYIAVAISHANVKAVCYAIGAMFLVILIYDQLIFRPLMEWAGKFKKNETLDEGGTRSWVLMLLERTHFLAHLGRGFSVLVDAMLNLSCFRLRQATVLYEDRVRKTHWASVLGLGMVLTVMTAISVHFVLKNFTLYELGLVFSLGAATALRVFILIALCSLVWVPVGVWIGMRPQWVQVAQPVAQFLASFPANALFPVVVLVIIKFKLNIEIWTTPLMILGSQWYLLFNVIAGASELPRDLCHVSANLGVKGWLWWKRFVLPGIFPYYITGAMTTAGAAWNASILAEVVAWGNQTFSATGLGAYISKYAAEGNFPKIALGTMVMCLFVIVLNRVFWQPLYHLAENRLK